MYEYPNEEVLLLEAIANGMDAKATKIQITLSMDNSGYYITFLNNGPAMTNAEFENYHTISSSTKSKGDGIGFAGVGAKIFLAAWTQAEIITITGANNRVIASKMFRSGNDVDYESTLDGATLSDITGKTFVNHKEGTSYKVKVNENGYKWLEQNITEKLQFWFNEAIVSQKLELKVNGGIIKKWEASR